MELVTPSPLTEGDRVAVVAPAGPLDKTGFDAGSRWLAQHFQPCFEDGIGSRAGFLAGSDERRAAELQAALDRPDARAVLSARGGYGTTRIIDRLDFGHLMKAPKWIAGSSDVTALLVQLWAELRLATIHGPMIAFFESGDPQDYQGLVDLLLGKPWVQPPGLEPLFPGSADGPLIGGNLTLLAHLCGAVSPSHFMGSVLFIEDVGEQPYRVDRCLVQLQRSGVMDGLAGVVVGQFTDCRAGPDGVTVDQVLAERLHPLGIPVALNYPAAHGGKNHPFVHGARIHLHVNSASAELSSNSD